MLVHLDLAAVFQLFCLVQGLTTAVYLLVARPRRPGNRWLGLLLLGLTLQVADYFLSRSGIYYRHRWLYFMPLFFSWSFGPLLLAYVQTRYPPARRLAWAHFAPGAVQLLFYLVLTVQSFDTKTWFWLHVHKPVTRYVEHYGAVLSMAIYLGLAWRLWRQHGQRPAWLGRTALSLGVFYAAVALDPLLNSWYLPAGAPKFYLSSLVLPVLAYGLALGGWLKSRNQANPNAATAAPATGVPAEVAPSLAAPVRQVTVDAGQLARLVQALEYEQLFKNPDLTLDDLARHVGLTPNGVSLLINAGLQQSFSDFVNGYRLAEVKQRLLTTDAQRLTVLGLALEAGFNSKTTFNRVFKEKTGLTPKEYQKKYQATHRDDLTPTAH